MHAMTIIENKDEVFKVLLWIFEKEMAKIPRQAQSMDFFTWVEKVYQENEKQHG